MSNLRILDLDRKDWEDHISKVARLGVTGDRAVYWVGATDVNPSGKRKQVFDLVRECSDKGLVRLYQNRMIDDTYQYIMEVV